MPQGSFVKNISPMLATDNMHKTIAFYRDVLGFIPCMQGDDYSILERDGRLIHLQHAASDEVMRCTREHTEIYIEVSGIHALWEHVRQFHDRYRIRDLFERDYGMTEFHIADPHGCLVFVGEATSESHPAQAELSQS